MSIENSKQALDRDGKKKALKQRNIDFSVLPVQIDDEIYIDPADSEAFLSAYDEFMKLWRK